MRSIRTIQSVIDSREDVLLFLQIFLLATVLPLLVKILSIPGLMKIITPRNPKSGIIIDLDGIRGKIEKYTDYILGIDCWIYKVSCLKRSLLLYSFLRKYGINVSVCFGVKYKKELSGGTNEKQVDGHAWLLYKGDIYLEKNIHVTKTYTMTYCYPGISDDMKEKGYINAIEGLK
jgi:hypothetical protein